MYIYFFKIKQDCDVTVLKNIIFHNANINNKSSITLPIPKKQTDRCGSSDPGSYVTLKKDFLEWFVGFTDGEGNFHIKLTDLKDNTYKSVQFTFQIGLHVDDLKVLEYIMNTIKCGHISKSKDRVNFFVNDINSLLYIIIPLFEAHI